MFRDITAYVTSVGYPRSGHSLVGSLINAHPEALIAHELDAIALIDAGSPARCSGLRAAGRIAGNVDV
jgi:hypothetical protein